MPRLQTREFALESRGQTGEEYLRSLKRNWRISHGAEAVLNDPNIRRLEPGTIYHLPVLGQDDIPHTLHRFADVQRLALQFEVVMPIALMSAMVLESMPHREIDEMGYDGLLFLYQDLAADRTRATNALVIPSHKLCWSSDLDTIFYSPRRPWHESFRRFGLVFWDQHGSLSGI